MTTSALFYGWLASWATLSIVRAASRLGRIATALDRLVTLAEQGRR